LQLFEPARLAYLLSAVRPMVELGDYLKQEGVKKPLPVLNNSSESKYFEAFEPKKLQRRVGKNFTKIVICYNILRL
jgi:hypothetical protein